MIKQFTLNLTIAILIITQTNLGAQKVDSLHARMYVTISSFRQGPDWYGEMRVLEEENIEYSTELVMKVGKCVEDFSNGPLTDYVTTLKGWKALSETLDAAVKEGPEVLKKVAGETVPRIKLLLGDTKSFEETGGAFYESFKTCPESMASGVELMKSALTITVDSITTKY